MKTNATRKLENEGNCTNTSCGCPAMAGILFFLLLGSIYGFVSKLFAKLWRIAPLENQVALPILGGKKLVWSDTQVLVPFPAAQVGLTAFLASFPKRTEMGCDYLRGISTIH